MPAYGNQEEKKTVLLDEKTTQNFILSFETLFNFFSKIDFEICLVIYISISRNGDNFSRYGNHS